MKKNKKNLTIIASIIAILSCFFFVGRIPTSKVYAIGNEFSVEQYTDDDFLLKADGTPSVKDISTFAEEVKSGKNTYYPELAEVIPRQYLESQDENAIFAYNGKEYGFYVAKNEENFDILLIDFVYEFEENDSIHNSDIEFRIRIKPLLQQSFSRTTDKTGAYTWKKATTTRKYYVANPRFISVVANENALNYGDDGYNKLTDDGVIISQFRTNYGKVSYATEKDLAVTLINIGGNKMFDFICDGIDAATGSVGGQIAKIIKEFKEIREDIYEAGKETTILADNENNIRTEMSKEAQKDATDIPGYSRVAGFEPSDEIILSGDNSSYAEFITVLNDANSRSRLYQYCDFDIVYRNSNFSSMSDPVAENCSFSKERVLYDDKTITNLQDEIIQENFAYILDGGYHKFTYLCGDPTTYQIISDSKLPKITFVSDDGVVEGQNVDEKTYEIALQKNKKYTIIFSDTAAGIYNFTFGKKFINLESFGKQNVSQFAKYGSLWFKYTPTEETYLAIDFDMYKYAVVVYDQKISNPVSVYTNTNHAEFHAVEGHTYYIQIRNDFLNDIGSDSIYIGDVESFELDEDKVIAVNEKRAYLFNAPIAGVYKITGVPTGVTANIDAGREDGGYLLSKGRHYIVFMGQLESGTCKITFNSVEIYVRGGKSLSVSGGTLYKTLKFKAPQTLNYKLSLPSAVNIIGTVCEGRVVNVGDADNLSLEKGKVYYFVVGGNMPDRMDIAITPVTVASITADPDGQVEKTISGQGTVVVEIKVVSDNCYYTFEGIGSYFLYDSVMDKIGNDSVLMAGTYYLQTVLNGSTVLTVSKDGIQMNVGDTIGVNHSNVFRYNLTVGEKYEVRIAKSSNSTFTTDVVISNINGQTCNLTKINDVYSFTAHANVVYVKLTMSNVGGQAGVFFLTKADLNKESEVQNIIPDQLYTWTIADQHFIKIPAGEYLLFIKKSRTTSICVYEINRNGTPELVGTEDTTGQDSEIKYSLSSTEEKLYLIVSNISTVDFVLSYSQKGVYKIEIEGATQDNRYIYPNLKYKFALYRCMGNTTTLVNNTADSDFHVWDSSDKEIVSVNGQYKFETPGTIFVSASFWGINAGTSYVVVNPEITIDKQDETGDLYFTSSGIKGIGSEYQLKNVTVTVTSNGANVYQKTYYTSTVNFNANDYIWYKKINVKFIYNYSHEDDELRAEGEATYNVPRFTADIKDNICLYDASSMTSIETRTIKIPANIKSIYFLSKEETKVTYLDIVAQSRSTPLKVFFKNFNYQFKTNGIYVDFWSDFTINVTGNCSIMPRTLYTEGEYGIYARNLTIEGTGKLSVAAGKRESSGVYALTNGYAGINANNLTVLVKELYVKGGTGGDAPNATGTQYADSLRGRAGNSGGNGGDAIWLTNNFKVMSSCKKITMEGGNGGHGGNGANGLAATADFATGGRGGNGGDGGLSGGAFHQNVSQSELYFSSSTTKVITKGISGDGGRGGNGGNGGRGGKGGNGGRGGDGRIGGRGGNGGNGGNGLDDTSTAAKPSSGGDGGNGGHGGYSDYSGKYERPGNGGSGGNGGDPGGVGGGLNGGNGGYGYNGGSGGNGSSSHIIFATGGNGGDGGDGYGGSVGYGGSGGKGTWASDGSSGSNGKSYSNYQNYPEDYN